ncbi:DUF1800 domain-containing protein [Usitatibacter palustris]|nr:DUF1800 domain-containing protein [Usitatibacter palustris]
MPKALAALLLASAPALTLAQAPTGLAVEFFNTATKHYYVSTNPAEATWIDSGGAGAGWSRTGGQFSVYLNAQDAQGLVPACLFYGTPGRGPNSHFFTANAAECEWLKTADPGWTYLGIPFHAQLPQSGACPASTTALYRSYNNGAARNDSNHRFTVDRTVFEKSASTGYQAETVVMCVPLSTVDVEADAVRLMRQATFGPREADVTRAVSIGTTAWIDEQLGTAVTSYPVYAWTPDRRPDDCVDNRTPPIGPNNFCNRDNYTLFPLQLQFFKDAHGAADQLRGRVAFALSQIFVTSGTDVGRNYAMRHYQQIFRSYAFGNFYDLMLAVTLSPVMGDYLDMANNNKTNVAAGTDPNENYAREILQLFSVGTFLLNPDGTLQRDSAGKAVPTYDLAEIKGFSRAFTGYTYPTVTGAASRNNNPRNYEGPMRAVDATHEFGTKVLLSRVVAPANMTMADDLAFAHRNIFNHANVGPFIGRQLIQKLVTSDPTPAYVGRVAAVFNNNGSGVRGDLRAVVRAILTDPEARGARKIDPAYGKLMEPALFLSNLTRAFGGSTDGVYQRATSQALGQFVFYPPSVFNYYPPDYVIPGTALLGPEFGIQTTTTAINRANVAYAVAFGGGVAVDTNVYGATGTQITLAPYQAVAADAGALADRLNRFLMAGRMSTTMRTAIVTAVNAVPATDTLNRARTAVYLVLASPQFQVER